MHEYLKNQRIKTEIVEFTTDRPKHGRRGSPAIPSGTKLYAIKYLKPNGGYFTYSYLHKIDAEVTIQNQEKHKTDNEYYWQWNMVNNIQDTLHFGK